MSSWEELPLNDVIELVIDHRGKTPKKLGFDDFFSEGYPVLSAKHVKTSGLVNLDVMRFANEEMYKKWMKEPVQKGDVILTSEAPLGELFYIDGSKKYVLGQRVFGLRPKSDVLDSMYLLVWLSSAEGQGKLQARATGSTVQGIKQSELLKITIPIPPIEIQKGIASIYGSLDQKIQLNTQINQTLEQIAQAIFKSWFIDFDPVHAKAEALANGQSHAQAERAAMAAISGKTPEELDRLHTTAPEQYQQLHTLAQAFPCEFDEQGVPKGWEWKPLKHFGAIICGKTPSKSKPEYYGNEIPFIKIPDMHNKIFITKSTDALSVLGGNSQRNKYIPKGSVCVSCIATVGLVSIATQRAQTNQQINSIIPNDMIFSEYLYLALSQPYIKKKMLDLASGGSATLNMNTTTFSNIEVINPSKDILDGFYNRVNSIFLKICENQNESEILSNVRDLLLPKLLIGEI